MLQLFFAGLATFGNPEYWLNHVSFVHWFGLNLPVFLLIFAWIGALPRGAYWQVLGLVGFVFAMYFTANMTSQAQWVGALHPVIAILLTALSWFHVSYITKLIFSRKGRK